MSAEALREDLYCVRYFNGVRLTFPGLHHSISITVHKLCAVQ